MITTKYGNEVKILERMGDGWVRVLRVSDNVEREWHASQLRGETEQDYRELHFAVYGNVSA